MKRRNVFTTSEVANICQVSTRVVTKWFDNGILKGFRLPGSKHRRFTYENINTFMTEEEMPVQWLEEAIQLRREGQKITFRDHTKEVAEVAAT